MREEGSEGGREGNGKMGSGEEKEKEMAGRKK